MIFKTGSLIRAVLLSAGLWSGCAAAFATQAGAAPSNAGAAVLAQSRATYAALRTYADTGVVTTEYRQGSASPLLERHGFRTFYAAPRRLLFDFNKGADSGGERLVIWGDGENFHTWWSATHVHEEYPRGQGANAFALSSLPTLGSALMVPPLLFPQAGLHGPLSDFELVRAEGTETIDGRSFYKLVGTVGLAFSTGTVSERRSTTVWIDTETLLVGRLLQDTPGGSGADTVDRITVRFQPQSNPSVDPSVFRFAVPPG